MLGKKSAGLTIFTLGQWVLNGFPGADELEKPAGEVRTFRMERLGSVGLWLKVPHSLSDRNPSLFRKTIILFWGGETGSDIFLWRN